MGLDVYVGPLSRYYTGQWETILQQYGRQAGLQVQVVRTPPQGRSLLSRLVDFFRPKPNAGQAVARWQVELSRLTQVDVTWDDDPDREYFTDKPGWDCYGALLLWAAYEEHGATKFPATAERWHEDPIFKSAAADESSKYRHLLGGTEIWLPAEIRKPIQAPTLGGEPAVVGSVTGLAAELRLLNDATWRADGEAVSAWRREGAESQDRFETSARFGFAVFSELADLAVQNRLPMKLDY